MGSTLRNQYIRIWVQEDACSIVYSGKNGKQSKYPSVERGGVDHGIAILQNIAQALRFFLPDDLQGFPCETVKWKKAEGRKARIISSYLFKLLRIQYVYVCVCTYICISLYICICVQIHVCICICMKLHRHGEKAGSVQTRDEEGGGGKEEKKSRKPTRKRKRKPKRFY